MTEFLGEDFLLTTESARNLFHNWASDTPIFDYHCHLPAQEIAQDHRFGTISEIWLKGDHYKWRAMRSNGVPEKSCTGDVSDKEKFLKWAETMPYAMRNPLFVWTHLELKRYFGIDEVLTPSTAERIYDRCNEMLAGPEFSVRNLLKRMNVTTVGTTDDPVDDLKWHQEIRKSGIGVAVRPTFRPDKAMAAGSPDDYNRYLDQLSEVAGVDIKDFDSLLLAVRRRHDFFHQVGCRATDHGLLLVPFVENARALAPKAFLKVRSGKALNDDEIMTLQCAFLQEVGRMNAEKSWVMQIHVGATRNNNYRMYKQLGPDTGFDAIGDAPIGPGIVGLLDSLEQEGKLPKTVLFNANPRDNELVGTLIGCYQGASTPGKIQMGPGWWFLDQIDGMTRQIEALSSLGLLGRFIGMTTDSRSFLSFPRHELFRRVLCEQVGMDIDRGLLPNDEFVGKIVKDICYHNAAAYFGE